MALDLGKQIGPLPMGAWIVVIGAGVGIAYTTRGAAGGNDPTVVTDTSVDPGVGEGGDFLTTTANNSGTAVDTIDDNDEWASRAFDYLVGQGFPAGISYSAITKALAGQKLSVQEYTLWQVALRGIGAPPTQVTIVPPNSVPGPVIPGTPPPTPGIKYHTIYPNSTLASVSRTVYGTTSKWTQIRDANVVGKKRTDNHMGFLPKTIGANTKLKRYVGHRLVIPPK